MNHTGSFMYSNSSTYVHELAYVTLNHNLENAYHISHSSNHTQNLYLPILAIFMTSRVSFILN